jgi:hypothetical protein
MFSACRKHNFKKVSLFRIFLTQVPENLVPADAYSGYAQTTLVRSQRIKLKTIELRCWVHYEAIS